MNHFAFSSFLALCNCLFLLVMCYATHIYIGTPTCIYTSELFHSVYIRLFTSVKEDVGTDPAIFNFSPDDIFVAILHAGEHYTVRNHVQARTCTFGLPYRVILDDVFVVSCLSLSLSLSQCGRNP